MMRIRSDSWLGRLVLTISRQTPAYRAAGLDRMSHLSGKNVESEPTRTPTTIGRNVRTHEDGRSSTFPSRIARRPWDAGVSINSRIVAIAIVASALFLIHFYHEPQQETVFRANPIAYFSVGSTSQPSLAFPVTFGPDRRILATGSADRTVALWNVGPLLATDNVLSELNFPSDTLATLRGFTSSVSAVAFSPDGRTLATGSANTIWLWDLTQPNQPHRLSQPLTGPTTPVSAMAFSPDGRTLATGSANTIWLWDLTQPNQPHRLSQPLTGPTTPVSAMAFSPDGRTLATGSANTIWLWDLTQPNQPHRLSQPLTGPTTPVSAMAFSPDGRTLATGSANTIWLWDLTQPNQPRFLRQLVTGLTASVSAVAFGPDGRILATGSVDKDKNDNKSADVVLGDFVAH